MRTVDHLPCRLTLDEKFALCRSLAEECIQEDELRALLDKKPNPVAYDGFEPSGRMHIAQGVLKALCVNKLTKSGVTFKFWWVMPLGPAAGRGHRRSLAHSADVEPLVWASIRGCFVP